MQGSPTLLTGYAVCRSTLPSRQRQYSFWSSTLQVLHLQIPNGTAVIGSAPCFLLLAVNNNRASRLGVPWEGSRFA